MASHQPKRVAVYIFGGWDKFANMMTVAPESEKMERQMSSLRHLFSSRMQSLCWQRYSSWVVPGLSGKGMRQSSLAQQECVYLGFQINLNLSVQRIRVGCLCWSEHEGQGCQHWSLDCWAVCNISNWWWNNMDANHHYELRRRRISRCN